MAGNADASGTANRADSSSLGPLHASKAPVPPRDGLARQFVAAQIVGGRDRQEDDLAILDLGERDRERLVFVIADGMGGHAGAADAARLAVRQFSEFIRAGTGPLPLRLRPALLHANASIALAALRDAKNRGAGCTLVAAVVEDNAVSWISVGDSPLYLFRRGAIRKLNTSHLETVGSGVGRLARKSGFQVLRSALTGKDLVLIDSSPKPLPLMQDDCIIVASDGLDGIGIRKLQSILRHSAAQRPPDVVDRLLRAVRSRPIAAQDNTTIIFYRVRRRKGNIDPEHRPNRPATWKLLMIAAASGSCLFAAAQWLLH